MAKRILRLLGYLLLGIFLLVLGLIAVYWQSDIPLDTLRQRYAYTDSRFVEVMGMPVHYRSVGKGAPLVLLHGTGASLHTWEAWTKELSNDFQVISLDLPAFGLTGPNPKRDYSVKFYTDFLAAFLQRIQVDTCYMAGNSLGGLIAWEFALAYPKVVRKMVLLDPAGIPVPGRKPPFVFQLARLPVVSNIFRYITPKSVLRNSLLEVYYNDSQVTDTLVNRYYDLSLREGNRGAFLDRARTVAESNWRKLLEIHTPTLILWGAEDPWIPVALGKQFADALPNDTLIVYPRVGHLPMEEAAKQSAADTRAFLLRK